MASFIVLLKNEIDNMKQEYEIEIEENRKNITNLENEINTLKIDKEQKDRLIERLKELQSTSTSSGLLSGYSQSDFLSNRLGKIAELASFLSEPRKTSFLLDSSEDK